VPIVYRTWITRDIVRNSPDELFVFGDNAERRGYGGQAAAMRGEPNTIGIATKMRPGMADADFFSDENPDHLDIIRDDCRLVWRALQRNKIINVPEGGIGTGLSQLPTRAPALYERLRRFFDACSDCPWPKFSNEWNK
jgi:hypothetical protein